MFHESCKCNAIYCDFRLLDKVDDIVSHSVFSTEHTRVNLAGAHEYLRSMDVDFPFVPGWFDSILMSYLYCWFCFALYKLCNRKIFVLLPEIAVSFWFIIRPLRVINSAETLTTMILCNCAALTVPSISQNATLYFILKEVGGVLFFTCRDCINLLALFKNTWQYNSLLLDRGKLCRGLPSYVLSKTIKTALAGLLFLLWTFVVRAWSDAFPALLTFQ